MCHCKDEQPREGSDLSTCLLTCGSVLHECRKNEASYWTGSKLRPTSWSKLSLQKHAGTSESPGVHRNTASFASWSLETPHTPCPAPLSLFSPLMCVITVKLGKVVSVPSTTTSCLPVRKELLIYHNTDMKMTSPGNNNIIIIICASAYEEMPMNTDAAACFGMFEKLRAEEGI